MDIFAGLNAEQRLAVEAINGRVLVLAGAGSGKTRVLTLRIAHLILNQNCPPESILGLTFTNKAAAEMSERLKHLIGPKLAAQVVLCTFHSFCMKILKEEIHRLGYTGDFTLYDEADTGRVINMIVRDLLEVDGENLPSLQSTIEAISIAKNQGILPQNVEGTGSKWHDQFTQDVYQSLNNSMRAYNAVDFDSLLSLTVELFENFPDVLQKYQERYRYLMIDEYQDTNQVQLKIAELLASKYNNICVVGDDDQSIYGWRGADVSNILNFKATNSVKLEQNYRSTNIILKAANAVIANNQKRHGKALWSIRGDGELIEVFHAPTEVEEAEAVVCRLDNLRINQGLRFSDMAILYRSNALSRSIEQALLKHMWKDGKNDKGEDSWTRGVPYHIHGGTEFYKRREVKDLVAYLRVIVNPLDEEALLRVINHPRRGVGESALDQVTSYHRSKGLGLWKVLNSISSKSSNEDLHEKLSGKALKGIDEFISIIESAKLKFSSGSLADTMSWLIDKVQYQKAINEEVKSSQMRDFKWENVQEFVSSLADFEERRKLKSETRPTIRDFVQEMALRDNWERENGKEVTENKVSLMTFHSAKGLEFPACFLIGMEDHIIPHEKSLKQTGVEEERRLMYVAMTRAMKFLTISMARTRKRMGIEAPSTPSRFILEVPKNYLKISKWHDVSNNNAIKPQT